MSSQKNFPYFDPCTSCIPIREDRVTPGISLLDCLTPCKKCSGSGCNIFNLHKPWTLKLYKDATFKVLFFFSFFFFKNSRQLSPIKEHIACNLQLQQVFSTSSKEVANKLASPTSINKCKNFPL